MLALKLVSSCENCAQPTDDCNDDGVPVCNSCAMDGCSSCLVNVPEIELSNGEYVCSNCYSGMVDSAHDYYEEG